LQRSNEGRTDFAKKKTPPWFDYAHHKSEEGGYSAEKCTLKGKLYPDLRGEGDADGGHAGLC
jgi:hypothetical protein